MSKSTFLTQFQEEQERLKHLQNREIDTVNVSNQSTSESKPNRNTLNKVNNFLQRLAAGLNAANFHSSNRNFQQTNQFQPQNRTVISAGQSSPINALGLAALAGGAIYLVVKAFNS